jgi:hypothetical protein
VLGRDRVNVPAGVRREGLGVLAGVVREGLGVLAGLRGAGMDLLPQLLENLIERRIARVSVHGP